MLQNNTTAAVGQGSSSAAEATPKMTPEIFDQQYKPVMDRVINLIGTHPDIPDDVNTTDLVLGLHTVRDVLEQSVRDNVAELRAAREEAVKNKDYITRLHQLNQDLNLQVAQQNQNFRAQQTGQASGEKPKTDWKELNGWGRSILG